MRNFTSQFGSSNHRIVFYIQIKNIESYILELSFAGDTEDLSNTDDVAEFLRIISHSKAQLVFKFF